MPVRFFHRTQESTEYTVLTHIVVWVKTKINIYFYCYFAMQSGSTFYRFGCTERGLCGLDGEVVYIPSQCGENAVCGSRNGVYGCYCDSGFSGDGQQCQSKGFGFFLTRNSL